MRLPEIGDILLEKYRLTSVLGEGGFGVVFKGATDGTGRPVAVKALRPKGDSYESTQAARFLREMKTVARLQSPHTVTLYDYGRTDEGVLFMVCEYVEGQDLSSVLANRGRLTESEAIHVLWQVLESLSEAHGFGVLHRDIKPSNIRLYEYDADPLRAKLLDFGLVRSYTSENTKLTAPGAVIGTPRYMAPEQVVEADLGPATDLFSLGVVLVEMLLGREITEGKPLWLRDFRLTPGDASAELCAIGNRLLARDLDVRYHSAADVLADLRAMRSQRRREAADAALAVAETVDLAALRIDQTTQEARRRTVEESLDDTLVRRVQSPEPVGGARPDVRRLVLGVVAVAACLMLLLLVWGVAPEDDATPPPQIRPSPVLVAPPAPPTKITEPESVGATPCEGYEKLPPGIQKLEGMRGIDREWVWVRIPPDYDPDRRHRVVLLLHEGGNPPRLELEFVEGPYIRPTDVVVAPREARLNRSWMGRDVGASIQSQLELAADVVCLDTEHLFVIGVGRGGYGAERLRCVDDRVAAVATTAHRMADHGLMCDVPATPLLEFHMMEDPIARPDGSGCLHPHASVDEHVSTLWSIQGCAGPTITVSERAEGTCVSRECETPYTWCEVDGGRPWRGSTDRARLGGFIDRCRSRASGYPYGEVIWAFFDEVSTSQADQHKDEQRKE